MLVSETETTMYEKERAQFAAMWVFLQFPTSWDIKEQGQNYSAYVSEQILQW